AILRIQRSRLGLHAGNTFQTAGTPVNKTEFPDFALVAPLALGARMLLLRLRPVEPLEGGTVLSLVERHQRVDSGLQREPDLLVAGAPQLAVEVHELQADLAKIHCGGQL